MKKLFKFQLFKNNHQKGFTLAELLITISVLSILVTTSVLVLRPQEFFAQSRDATRLADLNTLNLTISNFMDTSSTPNLAITNNFAPTTVDDSSYLSNLGLVSLPENMRGCFIKRSQLTTSSQCPLSHTCLLCYDSNSNNSPCRQRFDTSNNSEDKFAISTYSNINFTKRIILNNKNNNSTGWLPINLSSVISDNIPIDPTNDTTYYYAYSCMLHPVTGAYIYELNSAFESQSYKDKYYSTDGGNGGRQVTVGGSVINQVDFYEVGPGRSFF